MDKSNSNTVKLTVKLEITKCYGVRATTIEGQNAFAPLVARNYGEGEWTDKIYYRKKKEFK